MDSKLNQFELINQDLRVQVSHGQLTGLYLGTAAFMHEADEPGWSNSDTEMFPVIGPTSQLDYRLAVPRGTAILDQHGLLRDMTYDTVSLTATSLVLEKNYIANTPVRNGKFPERSPEQWLTWPYSFSFRKQFLLFPTYLEVIFTIEGDRGMPYMLGYHPAFRLQTSTARVCGSDRIVDVTDILNVGDRALELPGCEHLILEDKYSLSIETSGFGHFMLWTPHPGMLCIEPITYYPYSESSTLQDGFDFLSESAVEFKVRLTPKL